MNSCNTDTETMQASQETARAPRVNMFTDDEVDNYVTGELKQNVVSRTWYNTVIDFCDQYKELVKRHAVTADNITATINFVQELKVPFCYESQRLAFQQVIVELKEESDDIFMMMSSYLSEIKYHEDMLTAHGDDKLADSSMAFLQSMIEFYAHRIDVLKEDFEHNKRLGEGVLEESKQIDRPCGF